MKDIEAYITTVDLKPKKGFEFHGQWTDDKGTFYLYKRI